MGVNVNKGEYNSEKKEIKEMNCNVCGGNVTEVIDGGETVYVCNSCGYTTVSQPQDKIPFLGKDISILEFSQIVKNLHDAVRDRRWATGQGDE